MIQPRLLSPVLAAAVLGLALPAFASDTRYAYADVLRVDPLYETIRYTEPREECYDQEVVRRQGGDGAGGAVLGAIIGAAVGNQIGKGDGRRAATAAGAIAGGAIGHNTQRNNQREYASTERRCRILEVEREERRIAGYDVEYRYRGENYLTRMSYDPGDKLRVRVTVAPAD
jgi:uncharacterized protein YcfJ